MSATSFSAPRVALTGRLTLRTILVCGELPSVHRSAVGHITELGDLDTMTTAIRCFRLDTHLVCVVKAPGLAVGLSSAQPRAQATTRSWQKDHVVFNPLHAACLAFRR